MTKVELRTLRVVLVTATLAELRDKAKELGIVGRWKMKKDELVDAIYKIEQEKADDHEDANKAIAESGVKSTSLEDSKRRIELDSLVAFIVAGKKLLTGKVKNLQKNGCMVETSRGIKHTIKYEDISWVKTGNRWPNHIFRVLKGEAGVETICRR